MRGRVKRFIQNFLDTFYSLSKSIEGVGVDFTDLIIVQRESGYLNWIKLMKSNYRVFHGIGHQKHGCYEHVLALLRAQRASMSPKDWAQITLGQNHAQIHFKVSKKGNCLKGDF